MKKIRKWKVVGDVTHGHGHMVSGYSESIEAVSIKGALAIAVNKLRIEVESFDIYSITLEVENENI